VSVVAESTAWYVYGVVESSLAPTLESQVVEEGELAAVVDVVPLRVFGQEALEEHLNDRVWLETHARAHQEVLQEISLAGPVVPFRFGTIYLEADDVRAMLRARATELTAALRRVRGRVEIGVKAWAGPAPVQPSLAPSSGRAYLEQRLGAQERARAAAAELADTARDSHVRLLSRAVEGVANRPQPRELTGRDEAMILNGAYLVADVEPIRHEIERLASDYGIQGISFELTGPWPPYNFVHEGGEE
jgi:hypothetical protein